MRRRKRERGNTRMDKQLENISVIENILRDSQVGLWCIEMDEGKPPRLYGNTAFFEMLGMDASLSPEERYSFWYERIEESCIDSIQTSIEEIVKNRHAEVQYSWVHPVKGVVYVRCGGTRDLAYQKGIRLQGTHQEVSDIVQVQQNLTRLSTQRMYMIQALGNDYTSIYYYDFAKKAFSPFLLDDWAREAWQIEEGKWYPYRETMKAYIETYVQLNFRDELLPYVDVDYVMDKLMKSASHSTISRYQCTYMNELHYFYWKFNAVYEEDEMVGFVVGFVINDDEIERECEQRRALSDALLAAERASQAKTTFLNNMSHDIRTPMNAIIGFTALASTHVEQPELVKDYLAKIMTSSNHLLSLINDVLDMSRIESGKVKIEEKECNLPDIMHDIKNIVQADIHSKQLEFFIDTVDVVDESIICDKLRLNQVLLNCLSNAMKFTRPGGTVGVRVVQKANAPEGYADYDFIVRDTGIGMSREFAEHIFEPFTREQTTTVSGIPGTGLGMAITKNIVDMMGGQISVTSETGKGSEFKISLRMRLGSNPKRVEVIRELAGLRALVADDDYNTCVSVARMLKSIGLRSEFTTSGKEAVLRAKTAMEDNDNFKVYIIDWLMPDMNGVEVVRRIRMEVGDDVPIIILTAYDWTEIEEEAREAGVTAFCSKPIFLSELHDILLTAGKEEEPVKEKKRESFAGKRILLVEDIELNREIAETVLMESGFEIESAENGQVAVEMLQKSEPGYYDLVLMDIQMPVMDGYEATRQIRGLACKEHAEIPVIAMTANAFEEDRQKALAAGMNGYLAKPIKMEILYAVLEEYLS